MKIWVPVIKFKKIELGRAKHSPVFIESAQLNHRPAKKRRTKLPLIAIMIMLTIGVVIWLVVRALNAPVQGTINNSEATSPPPAPAAAGKYEDGYFKISYPSYYKLIPADNPSNYLSLVDLLSSQHPTTHIAIVLVKEAMSNDPGVNYRQMHTDLYKVVATTDSSLVFSRDGQDSEYTGFISHDGMVMSISLTSTGSTHLKTDYDFLANSLSWK